MQRELNTRERSSGGPGKKSASKSNVKIQNKPAQNRMDDIESADVEVPDDFEVSLDIGLTAGGRPSDLNNNHRQTEKERLDQKQLRK